MRIFLFFLAFFLVGSVFAEYGVHKPHSGCSTCMQTGIYKNCKNCGSPLCVTVPDCTGTDPSKPPPVDPGTDPDTKPVDPDPEPPVKVCRLCQFFELSFTCHHNEDYDFLLELGNENVQKGKCCSFWTLGSYRLQGYWVTVGVPLPSHLKCQRCGELKTGNCGKCSGLFCNKHLADHYPCFSDIPDPEEPSEPPEPETVTCGYCKREFSKQVFYVCEESKCKGLLFCSLPCVLGHSGNGHSPPTSPCSFCGLPGLPPCDQCGKRFCIDHFQGHYPCFDDREIPEEGGGVAHLCAFRYSNGKYCHLGGSYFLKTGSIVRVGSGAGSCSGPCYVCSKHASSSCIPVGDGGKAKCALCCEDLDGKSSVKCNGCKNTYCSACYKTHVLNEKHQTSDDFPEPPPPGGGGGGPGGGGGKPGGGGTPGGGDGGGDGDDPPHDKPEIPQPEKPGLGEGEYTDQLDAILRQIYSGDKALLQEAYQGNKEQYFLLSDIVGTLKNPGRGTPAHMSSGLGKFKMEANLDLPDKGEKPDLTQEKFKPAEKAIGELEKLKVQSADWRIMLPLSKANIGLEDIELDVSLFKPILSILRNLFVWLITVYGFYRWVRIQLTWLEVFRV